MDIDKTVNKLTELLPDRGPSLGLSLNEDRKKIAKEKVEDINNKRSARELARLKRKEKQSVEYYEAKYKEREALAEELGVESVPTTQMASTARKIAYHEENVAAIEALEVAETLQEPAPVVTKVPSASVTDIMRVQALQGTTRADVVKLLTSLGINLNLQLTKNDTANLLACLLTCSETQLKALMHDSKVPIAIKTVIKRLLEDVKVGNIDTVEKLWDRIFGKQAMSLNLPDNAQVQTGIIPNQPISREAYILIRDTLI